MWYGTTECTICYPADQSSLQDIDLCEIQRILKVSKEAAKLDSNAITPVLDRAVVQLNKKARSWQHPKQEESAERKPLFDAGLALIAEVRIHCNVKANAMFLMSCNAFCRI